MAHTCAHVWDLTMPGINIPGNYMDEYGRDPVSYIKKEIAIH